MRPLKEKISITINSDLLEKVRKEAEWQERSVSCLISCVLKKYLSNSENSLGEPLLRILDKPK